MVICYKIHRYFSKTTIFHVNMSREHRGGYPWTISMRKHFKFH